MKKFEPLLNRESETYILTEDVIECLKKFKSRVKEEISFSNPNDEWTWKIKEDLWKIFEECFGKI